MQCLHRPNSRAVTELKARRADRSEIRPVYEKYVKASIMVLAKDIEERKGQRYKSRSSLEKEKANLEVGIKRGQVRSVGCLFFFFRV